MSDLAASYRKLLARFHETVVQLDCPLCRMRDWDEGAIVAAPLLNVQNDFHFDREEPFRQTGMFASFVCQNCHHAVLLFVGTGDLGVT